MMRPYRAAAAALLLMLAASAAQAAYSPATTNGWFVFVGRKAGASQSLFRTDLWLFNPDTTNSVTATLIFHPEVASDTPTQPTVSSAAIILAPRETKFFSDVTFTTVPAGDDKAGALEWTANGNLMGGVRVYTVAGGVTYGFFVPAVPSSESMTAKTSATDSTNVLQMYGMSSNDPNFRVSLDVTNTSGVTVPVEVKVIDPVTQVVYGGTRNYNLSAKSLLRLGNILTTVGAPLLDGLRVTVAIKEGTVVPSGGILAVTTTLDNRTNDGFAFVGQRQSGTVVPAEMLPVVVAP